MRVVVTGAAGFIGSHVSEALLARGDEVVGVDNFNDFYDPAIKEENAAALLRHDGFSLVRGDLLDPGVRATALEGLDAIIHLAASAGVRPSIDAPPAYQRNNVEVTVSLLEDMRRMAEKSGTFAKVVLASSSSVYGANEKVPFSEDDPVDHPVSPYAATKKACELLSHTYHHLFDADICNLRYFTVYGPRQRPEMAIHKFARLMSDGEAIPMFGDGSSARDYTFVADIVQGTLAALDKSTGYRVYNLGNSDSITLKELIDEIGVVLGITPKIDQLPMQPGDVPRTFADITRAKSELGYDPQTPVRQGLRVFAEWFRERRSRAA
jgi:UDP-glucuronate 4-epimerase